MPQVTIESQNIIIMNAVNSIIDILKKDTYFQTLLKDDGDTEYINKYNSNVIIRRFPLEYLVIKKYPAISIFPSLENRKKEGEINIQIAHQSRNEDDLIGLLWSYYTSLRYTVEPYKSLCNTVQLHEFLSAELDKPYKDTLMSQMINIKVGLTYNFSYIR